MCILIPIRYRNKEYPNNIMPKIEEISARFDIKKVIRPKPEMDYSLHTDYGHYDSELNRPFLTEFETIKGAYKNHIPQLWSNEKWAKEFAVFIKRIVGNNKPPRIIEIHPPFKDYCESIEKFIDIYKLFEEDILLSFPDVKIVMENRCGTLGKETFLISTSDDILELYRLLNGLNLRLRIALDFPQLFSSEKLDIGKFSKEKIVSILRRFNLCSPYIIEFHIWGKKLNAKGKSCVHCGDLNTYFKDEDLKHLFLKELFYLFDDRTPRYFLPEVNSSKKDVASIVEDFSSAGFKFENM